MDLFEHYDQLPPNMIALLGEYSEMDATYENCRELLAKTTQLGYDFEWGLDAIPYDLKKL